MQAASLSYLGLFFGISVVIGMVFGGWLDKRFHTAPWLRIVGVMLGLATGFNELYRVATRYQRKLSQEAQRPTNEAKDSPPALLQAEEKPPKTAAKRPDKGSSADEEKADEEKDEAEAEEEEARRKKDAWV